MRRALIMTMVIAVLSTAACASRPPIDVYGHKDSVYKYVIFGVPI